MLHSLTNRLRKKRANLILALIIIFGFFLRTYNLNWDDGHYFHPDERAIIMAIVPLHLPASFEEFLDSHSPLNPHFFAYGNFPFYLLKFSANLLSLIFTNIGEYGSIHIIGRTISALFDCGTIFLIFLLGRKLKNTLVGMLSAFCYSIFVFPIQLSHFFAVDTILNFFLVATLLTLISFYKNPSIKKSILLGICFGMCLATKISGLIIVPIIALVFVFQFYQSVIIRPIKFVGFICYLGIFLFFSIIFFIVTQPYVLIDFNEFIKQTTLQSQMSKDPFVFPYTLQYVGKIPYLHEIYNILFFGVGLPLSIIGLSGIILATRNLIVGKLKPISFTIVLVYFWFYFLVFGSFAVGWMRYMLPVYPIIALGCGVALHPFFRKINIKSLLPKIYIGIIIVTVLVYPLSFLSIYQKPNTRVQASEWINKNIPHGSKLALEHWDDGLPVFGVENYQLLTLPLYDADTNDKWATINTTLNSADYIILASNRLYVPLQKLIDCNNLPPGRCYPITSQYYKNLFAGKMGFEKIAEFESPPTIPIFRVPIHDQSADESFTVYDHPKIFIFKKVDAGL